MGALFKMAHWPGANALLVTGISAGIILFILLIASFRGKGPGGFEKYTRVIAAATIILVLLAFLFKILHLAGAAKLIWIADIGILLSFLFFLVDSVLEKDPEKRYLKLIAAFFALILILMLMLLGN
jgi:hypothetical protein